ncbi:peroxisomal membrane protein pex14, partial [Dissophora ornata]
KLDEQFDEIEKSLAEVKESTTIVAKDVEDQTAHLKESLEGMSGVLDGMKSNDDKREQELAGLKTDIDNIKTMIPKLMEKNKESQTNTMNELQTEIKSLKSLLLNRRGVPGAPGASPVIPGNTSAAPWNAVPSYSPQSSSPSIPTALNTTGMKDDVAMNFLNTKASIPAWQLAAQKAVVNNANSSNNNSDATLTEAAEPTA